jgi:hypothetical protein
LTFPVVKECNTSGKCLFSSTANDQLKAIVQPSFLALSLFLIAAGIFMVRFGRRYDSNSKRAENAL